METDTSPSGWSSDPYTPPGFLPRLTVVYCKDCAAGELCGERHADSACGDPAEYDPGAFHPATTPKRSIFQELVFPSPRSPLRQFDLAPSLVIAKDSRPAKKSDLAVCGPSIFNGRGEVDGRVAVLVGSDRWIHSLWGRRGRLGQDLQKAGFSGVVAPAYSTYWSDTPFEGLIEVRRTLAMASILQRHLPVIPTLAWRNKKDLSRWADWLMASRASTIAVHLGMRPLNQWKWHLAGLEILAGQLGSEDLRLVAIGPSTIPRVSDVFLSWPGPVTIASQRPWHLAQQGRVLGDDLRPEKDLRMTREELVDHNARMFAEVVEGIARSKGLYLVP